ncbi:MAG: endonuclease/exonuclease/phosphatase family protein [Actinobacteria bacterium]|nr:endonuclease/exonuclease/phosphatase family protein [Actinomycetota bacterium]
MMTTLLTTLAWVCVTVTQLVVLSIVLRVSRSIVFAVLQAVIPYATALNVVIAVFAVVTTNWQLVAASLLLVAWIVLIILRAMLVHRPHRPAAKPMPRHAMTVVHANLLYINSTPTEAINDLLATDADIITISELTSELHEALVIHEHASRWPHRHVLLETGADGIGVWSRHQLVGMSEHRLISKPALSGTAITSTGQSVGLVVVHPTPPVNRAKTRDWTPSLKAIGDLASMMTAPTVVIGDFNTAFWHPPMRHLLRRGFRSAHLVHGKFLAGTFPVGKKTRPVVRLDHALVTSGVTVHEVHDFTVTGSDHRGISVTVSTTAHATH